MNRELSPTIECRHCDDDGVAKFIRKVRKTQKLKTDKSYLRADKEVPVGWDALYHCGSCLRLNRVRDV